MVAFTRAIVLTAGSRTNKVTFVRTVHLRTLMLDTWVDADQSLPTQIAGSRSGPLDTESSASLIPREHGFFPKLRQQCEGAP